MRTKISLTCALILLAVFALPTFQATAAGPSSTASFGSDTQLSLNGAVEVGSEVTVTFQEVLEDSRCPTGTQCVWEGNAKVQFSVQTPNGTETIVLNTNGGAEYPSRASAGNYTVHLNKLDPYPAEGKPVNPKRYSATIAVTRGTNDA